MGRKPIKSKRVVAELKRLSKKSKGVLLPEDVVRAARDKDSVLHDCFEWDDKKAGHAYRIWQARKLISVSVEYLPEAQREYDVFVSLTPDRQKGGYREIKQVLSDDTLRKILLNDALNEMDLFMEKYNQLKELTQVFEVMDMALKKHSTKHKKTTKSYHINPSFG